jgi:DNA-directed RNA polymerase subunit RPC12/RpoP|tara:strand:+ start:3224 stop:3637 length:414 start_codon:yes stop_codon:yes gene_type:complete
MQRARFIKKSRTKENPSGREKGAPYELRCPDCGDDNSGRLSRYGDDKQQKELNKIAGLDGDEAMFWKCSGCGGEFFDDEVERVNFKTATFKNEDGETVFVPYTKKYCAKRQSAGTLGRKRPKGLSWKDKKMLRRLKK